MSVSSTVKVVINFNDPEANAEEREREVQRLLKQLKELDEIESVGRVPDPNPPIGTKALGSYLIGLLTAEIKIDNFKKVMGFLGGRLMNKTIEFELEANGRKLKLKVNNQEDMEAAIKAAKDFAGIE
jgi:hypothetical protein